MGDSYASLALLADAIGAVQRFVTVFIAVYLLLIFVYILASWFRVPDSLRPLVRFLHDVCDPYLRIFRRVIPPLGPVDVSPIVAVGVLIVLQWLINSVLLENLQ
jgi:YggT family protein